MHTYTYIDFVQYIYIYTNFYARLNNKEIFEAVTTIDDKQTKTNNPLTILKLTETIDIGKKHTHTHIHTIQRN